MKAHRTALVDPGAKVADDVEIGPFCLIGPRVTLEAGCRLAPRVTISGTVVVGRDNVFHPNAAIGGAPQDLAPAAPDGRIEIGDGNVFRESSTVHLPKRKGGVTRIGNKNRLHFCSHVGHDSTIGNDVILCSHAVLGGHTVVQDGAWIEGQGGSHQFVTIGKMSWTKTHIPITEDVPPFMWVDGNHFEVKGVNPRCRSEALERAFSVIWTQGLPRPEAFAMLEGDATPEVRELVEFLRRSALGRKGRSEEARRA